MAFPKLGKASISVEALVFVPVLHEGSYFCPPLGVLLVEVKQLAILLGVPGLNLPLGDVLVFLFDLHVDGLSFLREQADHKLFLHSSIN